MTSATQNPAVLAGCRLGETANLFSRLPQKQHGVAAPFQEVELCGRAFFFAVTDDPQLGGFAPQLEGFAPQRGVPLVCPPLPISGRRKRLRRKVRDRKVAASLVGLLIA